MFNKTFRKDVLQWYGGLGRSLEIQVQHSGSRKRSTESQRAGHAHDGGGCPCQRHNAAHAYGQQELRQEHHARDNCNVGAEPADLAVCHVLSFDCQMELKKCGRSRFIAV